MYAGKLFVLKRKMDVNEELIFLDYSISVMKNVLEVQ